MTSITNFPTGNPSGIPSSEALMAVEMCVRRRLSQIEEALKVQFVSNLDAIGGLRTALELERERLSEWLALRRPA